MPLLDFPLEQLKKYKGSTPKPDNFDEYWTKALKEIENIDYNVELKKIDYPVKNVEFFDVYYTGTRGARIHAIHARPKDIQSPTPCILEFHGYSMNAGALAWKLQWVAMGYSVFSMDCRGQGGKSEDLGGFKGTTFFGHIVRGLPSNDLLFKHIFLDGVILSRIASQMGYVDENNLYTTGGSQGGGLSLAVAGLYPKIKKVAAAYPFLSDYKRVWELNYSGAYSEIHEWFRRFDPTHSKEKEIFTTLGYIDIQNLAPKIEGKVLICIGLEDETCPPSTVFAAYNKIKSKKQIIVYPDYKHESIQHWSDEVVKFFAT